MPKLEKQRAEIHDKTWGWEEWVVNNEQYCGKLLYFIKAHTGTSMHFHMDKLETMRCVDGRLEIEYIDTDGGQYQTIMLDPGDSVTIQPGLPHRLTPRADDTQVYEFSTHHEDSDSYRVGPRLGKPLP